MAGGLSAWAADPGAPTSARVVIIQNPQATEAYQPRPEIVQTMVDAAMLRFTGSNTVAAAWGSLVSTNDTVGIKVYCDPGPASGTRPAVAAAVVQGLLAAQVPPNRIVIWDRRLADLRRAGFDQVASQLGVRLVGSADTGYDKKAFYETALVGRLVWGDVEFGETGEGIGRKSYVSKLVSSELTKIINLPPLLNNNDAGVAGNLYSLSLGSVDNIQRFEDDPDRLATAVPEIYALPQLGDHVVLNIVDALVCQYEGGAHTMLHYATTLNQLRFSRDPVALDVLSIDELERLRVRAGFPSVRTNLTLYQNASLLELGVSDPAKIHIEKIP